MKSRTRPKSICHAPECAEEISCGKLMCRPHWFALPRPLRQAISSAWKERRLADWSANCLEARRVLATTPAPASPAWPFGELQPGKYGVIYADPPWRFSNFSAKGEAKNPVAHYPCMKIEDLARLPVSRLAAPDCALIMWATAPLLDRAIELLKEWGFTFKSAGAWAKQTSTGTAWAFGTGYVFRSAAEFYLVGTIGKPRVLSRSVRNLLVAPTREHSRKPDQMLADVEALYAGPYAELFARQRRLGWDSWGNDVDRFPEGEVPCPSS